MMKPNRFEWDLDELLAMTEGDSSTATEAVVQEAAPDKIRSVLLLYGHTQEDIKRLSEDIFKLSREAYDTALTEAVHEVGCDGAARLMGGPEMTQLKKRAQWAAESIARTFNRDTTRMLESYTAQWVDTHGSEEGLQRLWLAKQLREGLAKRAEWKDKQISITERAFAVDRARLDFWRRNGIEGMVRVRPVDAVCPICKGYVAKGWVTMAEAQREFTLPAHVNCPHLLQLNPDKRTVPPCEELWRGETKAKYAREGLAEVARALEAYPAPHLGRPGMVGGSRPREGGLYGAEKALWGKRGNTIAPETGLVMDHHGNKLLVVIGGIRYFQLDENGQTLARGNIVSHNHDTDESFGKKDWIASSEIGLREMRAVSERYVFSLIAKLDDAGTPIWERPASIGALWDVAQASAYSWLNTQKFFGRITKEDAALELHHETCLRLARSLHCTYLRSERTWRK